MHPLANSGIVSTLGFTWRARARRLLAVLALGLGITSSASAAAVDWRLLGDWADGGPHAGFVITFAADGGYVIAQEGVPAGFGSYAVDGRQIVLFPGGAGEFPERGAYGFSGPDRLTVMTQNFGRSEWQRLTPVGATDAGRRFEYDEQTSDDKSSFERAVEKLEKISESLDGVERKLDGDATKKDETATASEADGKKRSLFDRMKDAARKTAGTAGNLSRKAARSVKAAGDAWKRDDPEKSEAPGATATATADDGSSATPVINPMLGGAVPSSTSAPTSAGLAGGITAPTQPVVTAFGAAPAAVPVDAALAQRATQFAASQWKADARLVEIVAHVGSDGNADVASPPQAVSMWFASMSAPGEGVMMSLAPDGSFVSAPAVRTASASMAPAGFIPAGQAIHAARAAGVQGDAFSASLRVVPGAGAAGFGWIVAPTGGGREIVIDAVSGQPVR